MPCGYVYPEEAARILRHKLNTLTRICCDMRTIIRRHSAERELTVDSREWIAQHDEEDATRIRDENSAGIREKTRQAALDKLSLEERRVLGL